MPRDAQISNSSSEAAPKDYTIPGNAELVLRAVQATFTDNGASGDWLPCLTLISDSGHTIARACDQGVKVTAGSDASVSWFPDVTRAQVAASGGTSLPACFVDGPALTLSTWTPNVYTAVTWDLFQTNDATVFSWPGSGGNTTVRHATNGAYRAVFIPQFQGFNFPVAPGLFIYTVVGSVFGGTRDPTEFSINHTNAAWAEGNTNASARDAPHLDEIYNLPLAGDIFVDTAWTGAGTITFTPRMYVYRIGDHLV